MFQVIVIGIVASVCMASSLTLISFISEWIVGLIRRRTGRE